VITPIHKKRDIREVRNYKGIILLCTTYKIYAAILAERLSEERGRETYPKHRQVLEKQEEPWTM